VNDNHTRFGRHVDELVDLRHRDLAAGADEFAFIDDLVFFLLELPEVDDLVDAYERFAPNEIFAPADASFFASERFAGALLSCPDSAAEGMAVFVREGSCAWGQIGGRAVRRDNGSGADEDVFALSGGLQSEVSPGWFAGGAVSYERSSLSGDGLDGEGNRFQLGAVVKRELGATTLAASISGGVGSYDLSRPVIIPDGPVTADGEPDTRWVAVHGRAARVLDLAGASYLEPSLDLGLLHFRQDRYTETGAGDYGLEVDAFESTLGTLAPTLELGTAFAFRGMEAEATVRGGVLAVIWGTERSTEARLNGVGPDGPGFVVANQLDDLYATVGGRVEARLTERLTLRVGVQALLGDEQQAFDGSARLALSF
jgi:uncharacterized protein with beta-barrel porin domain